VVQETHLALARHKEALAVIQAQEAQLQAVVVHRLQVETVLVEAVLAQVQAAQVARRALRAVR
jgi:hypothetical protein